MEFTSFRPITGWLDGMLTDAFVWEAPCITVIVFVQCIRQRNWCCTKARFWSAKMTHGEPWRVIEGVLDSSINCTSSW